LFRQVAIDVALCVRVTPRNPAINGVNMVGATTQNSQRYGETVAWADLSDASREAFETAIGKIVSVNPLDIAQRSSDIEVCMAGARAGFQPARCEALPRPPIVIEIIGARECHAALDKGLEFHAHVVFDNMQSPII